MSDTERRFFAYRLYPGDDMPLSAAPVGREWMDASDQRAAYRCLPLAIANQAGWLLPSPASFSAWWDGGPTSAATHLAFDPPPGAPAPDPFAPIVVSATHVPVPADYTDARVKSHFGHGVVTFTIPYLFRTPPGVNLWVKGPSNAIKDGVQPLEGIVETDWLPATFTMNWKLTRPRHAVRFERGEPVCMLVPLPRRLAEGLEPLYAPLDANPELARQFREWEQSRTAFNADLDARRPEAVRRGWQRDYMKGLAPGGGRAEDHQTRLPLREFTPAEAEPGPPN